MSQTYIGPFGRILPLPGRPDTPPAGDQSSRMLAGQIQLPLPTRLNFGSDPRPGYPVPRTTNFGSTRLDSADGSSRPFSASRSASSLEKLPSVRHLLTPGSQTEPSPSQSSSDTFYSPRGARPGSGHDFPAVYQSPQNSILAGSHLRSEAEYFPGSYRSRSPPSAQHDVDHSFSTRNGGNHYDGEYRVHGDFGRDSYGSASDSTGMAPSNGQNNSGHTGWYQSQGSPYDPARASSSNSATSRNDAGGTSGPVVKLIGERVFPGEGLCYVYDDGSHVKKMIDGEKVNAQWGITKAGKPRKRLAIACMTCREKKIKCDPAEPKCVQCEKSGRECRFQAAPRQVNRPGSPSYEQQARTPSSVGERIEQNLDFSVSPGSSSSVSGSTNDSRYRSPSSASSSRHLASSNDAHEHSNLKKRRRESLHDSAQLLSAAQSKAEDGVNTSNSTVFRDPYLFDPHFTLQSVSSCLVSWNSFFSHIFPPKAFLCWMQTSTSKTPEEIMVLYAMIALGSQRPDKGRSKSESSLFLKMAKDAVKRNSKNPSVHVIQAKLFIGEYFTTSGDVQGGIDFAASATSAALNQRLNLQEEELSPRDSAMGTYGLNCHAWAECRRRTFWSAFLLDRYQALATDRPIIIQKEDIILRLPCNDKLFEEQVETCTPYLDNGIVDERLAHPSGKSNQPGLLGYLIRVSSISGDVLRESYRGRNQAPEFYPMAYERVYAKIHTQLNELTDSLPEHLKLNTTNAINSMERGYSILYTNFHASYYLTIMVLTRRVRPDLFTSSELVRNTRDTIESARQLLHFIHSLLGAPKASPHLSDFTPPPSPRDNPHQARNESSYVFRCSREYTAFCTLYSADVLSSAGSLERGALNDTLADMEVCYDIMERLSRDSHEIPPMKQAIERRLKNLQALSSGTRSGKSAWAFKTSMLRVFGPERPEMDLFYPANGACKALEARGLDVAASAIIVI